MSKKDTMYITRNSFSKFATGQASQASSLFVQAGNGNFAFVRLQKQPVKGYLPQGFFLIPGTERKVQTVANQILSQLYFPTEAMNNPRHTRLQIALQLYQFGLCLHCMNDQRFAYCFGHTSLITENIRLTVERYARQMVDTGLAHSQNTRVRCHLLKTATERISLPLTFVCIPRMNAYRIPLIL